MQALQFIRYLPLSILRGLARSTAWLINQQPKKGMLWKTLINLNLVYPELEHDQREQLAKESINRQCLAYIESAKCWAMPAQWSVDQIKDVYQLDVLRDALNSKQGALIIVPHLGTWEIMNAWLLQFGTPTIMYKPMKNAAINDFVLNARQRLNAHLVPTDASGVKALFKELKSGGFSIILPDHVPQPSGGVVVPFFGIETITSTLASKMAQKTKCKLVGLSCFRRDDGEGFDVFCDALNNEQLYDPNLEIAVTALNIEVEKMINRSTADYMWGYKRFKQVPHIANVYQKSSQ